MIYSNSERSEQFWKLNNILKEDVQDSEFRWFFGRIHETLTSFRDLLTFMTCWKGEDFGPALTARPHQIFGPTYISPLQIFRLCNIPESYIALQQLKCQLEPQGSLLWDFFEQLYSSFSSLLNKRNENFFSHIWHYSRVRNKR